MNIDFNLLISVLAALAVLGLLFWKKGTSCLP
jgi:hypothetical protein